jgi:hypothetical protein
VNETGTTQNANGKTYTGSNKRKTRGNQKAAARNVQQRMQKAEAYSPAMNGNRTNARMKRTEERGSRHPQ